MNKWWTSRPARSWEIVRHEIKIKAKLIHTNFYFPALARDRYLLYTYPDSKVHGANKGPTWVLSAPGWPVIGPMNFAIRVGIRYTTSVCWIVPVCMWRVLIWVRMLYLLMFTEVLQYHGEWHEYNMKYPELNHWINWRCNGTQKSEKRTLYASDYTCDVWHLSQTLAARVRITKTPALVLYPIANICCHKLFNADL